ncbi:hypothetical protein NPIL_228901 [Nephila pilipes]|uniref:Uncharacterized protein n=1 Tax=Nephila pilipes TaxID=299642 RepID=A0A8X6P1U9_NEPPI|nr:hypothetical protein NPIL_228901 [Nephila pilipes]
MFTPSRKSNKAVGLEARFETSDLSEIYPSSVEIIDRIQRGRIVSERPMISRETASTTAQYLTQESRSRSELVDLCQARVQSSAINPVSVQVRADNSCTHLWR